MLQTINNKIRSLSSCTPVDITHLVRFHSIADDINKLACLTLPQGPEDLEPIILIANNHIDNQECDAVENNHSFHQHTNLPMTLILQKGTCVMYFDNALFEHGLYNGSIRVIIELINEDTVNVVFLTSLRMIIATVKRLTKHFFLNAYH
ncbi:20088_t:CDS:1 [Cetraspora pellucida]|uniref:20088_t:CDS:1 n=1 Tax=Cetraspora pellucida TaxID=1433469 RepID=A0A9N8Z7Z3_9GLOM|nr:20088_t:CDS:1 [Cetraspora pellucida]